MVRCWARWSGWVALLCVAMLIGTAYSLRVMGRLCLKGEAMALADMSKTEMSAAGVLVVCIVVLGVWPTPLLNLLDGSVGLVARWFNV